MVNTLSSAITAIICLIAGAVLQVTGTNGAAFFFIVGGVATVWTSLLIRNLTRSQKHKKKGKEGDGA